LNREGQRVSERQCPARTRSGNHEIAMNSLLQTLAKSSLLKRNLDDHLIRASMVIIFLLFGYQKWFEYEVQVLVPYISNGPLVSWLYPAFGIRGGSWFLGIMEWLFCLLLFWGFWNRDAGNPRGPRLMRYILGDRYDHSIHAERMGRGGRRLSSNDR
jgi:uncharacterized protein DUF417